MMQRGQSPTQKAIPPFKLGIVGSNKFGRYPNISVEQTFNMIISNNTLVDYAGYRKVVNIVSAGQGRGLHVSKRFGRMVAVVNNGVYVINSTLSYSRIASIGTSAGDVYMAENNGSQIAICDKQSIYIFDYVANTFAKADINFLPGYIAFQNTYFISVDLKTSTWRLSDNNNGLVWPIGTDPATGTSTGTFQTKGDNPVAAFPVPSKGNLLFVMGNIVTESWYDLGRQLFPYEKSTFSDIDYGCLNSATIAFADKFVVWMAVSDKSGPVLMVSDGGDAKRISDDGMNFKFARLTKPQNCYGFLFEQDGHLIYQFTWPDDNLSYIYDFETASFFSVTDENFNYHIAKRAVFFNNKYYFISFNDGDIYEFGAQHTSYDGKMIPRRRLCPKLALPNDDLFVVNNVNFPMEQGSNQEPGIIEFTMSKNGGVSFSNAIRKALNPLGKRQNRFVEWDFGVCNSFVPQFLFWSTGRFVISEGEINISQ
jgi:hypothetical protein